MHWWLDVTHLKNMCNFGIFLLYPQEPVFFISNLGQWYLCSSHSKRTIILRLGWQIQRVRTTALRWNLARLLLSVHFPSLGFRKKKSKEALHCIEFPQKCVRACVCVCGDNPYIYYWKSCLHTSYHPKVTTEIWVKRKRIWFWFGSYNCITWSKRSCWQCKAHYSCKSLCQASQSWQIVSEVELPCGVSKNVNPFQGLCWCLSNPSSAGALSSFLFLGCFWKWGTVILSWRVTAWALWQVFGGSIADCSGLNSLSWR